MGAIVFFNDMDGLIMCISWILSHELYSTENIFVCLDRVRECGSHDVELSHLLEASLKLVQVPRGHLSQLCVADSHTHLLTHQQPEQTDRQTKRHRWVNGKIRQSERERRK